MHLPETEFLACKHLEGSAKDLQFIRDFEVPFPETGKGLEVYLKDYAIQDEQAGRMRTYLVSNKATNESVGYFSLKAGLISINEVKQPETMAFDTLPGVELANFAVNRRFVDKYDSHGIGHVIFRELIIPFIFQWAENLGICVIYIFALPYPKLITAYSKYGFQRLSSGAESALHRRLKPNYDQSCIFMYQLLHEMRHG